MRKKGATPIHGPGEKGKRVWTGLHGKPALGILNAPTHLGVRKTPATTGCPEGKGGNECFVVVLTFEGKEMQTLVPVRRTGMTLALKVHCCNREDGGANRLVLAVRAHSVSRISHESKNQGKVILFGGGWSHRSCRQDSR